MTRARLLASAAFAAAIGLPLAAQAGDADNPDIVVTATRLPAPAASTPDAHVITEDDIQARQAIFAADVLATVPGVVIVPTGAFGGVTGVSIRGATTDKTLVLIDGVPVNDASQPEGGFDFGALDLADVSRIEVLTGPQGVLWGSNAIGGVVSFTTKEPNGVDAAVEGGSLSTWRGSLSLGKSNDRWALGGTIAGFTTAGVSAADTHDNYAPFGLPGLHNTEADGDQMLTADLRARITLSGAVQLDGQVRYNHARTAIDGFPPPDFLFSDTNDVAVSESVEAFVRARIAGPWGLKNEVSVSDYRIERGDHGKSGDFGFTAGRQVYRWTLEKDGPADRWSAIAGVEREATSASLSSGKTFDLGATSVFALAQGRPTPWLTGLVGVRYDAPDRFRAQTTARVGATIDLPRGFSLQGSFNQSFKTPTISETACDFCFAPPVSLRPEHAEGYDGALAWRSSDGKLQLKATAFSLDVTDEIAFVAGRYVNIARARSRGLEAEADAVLPYGLRLQASYSYIDATNALTGVRLPRSPLNSGSASLFWTHGPWDAAFTVRAEDQDLDTGLDFSPVVRPGFAVADLAGGYRLNGHVRLTARVENLADRRYEEAFGFGEPGRTVFVGVRLAD
ncbi:MAG TPA: TonB-dependent receptor [Caulobacteraceae bacterium]|nr:TonB-dependent receptor [Caulobacteraceae bacterium]